MHIWLPYCQTVHWDFPGRYSNQERACQQAIFQIQSRFLKRRCEGVNASTVWFSTEDKGKHAVCRRTGKVFKRQPKNRGRENWNIGYIDMHYGNVLFILHWFLMWIFFFKAFWLFLVIFPVDLIRAFYFIWLSKSYSCLFNNLALL